MSFRVSGKNLDVGEALRERINERIGEAHGQIFRRRLFRPRDGGAGRLRDFAPNARIHLDSKVTLRAEGRAPDAYASADQAALRVEKRLRRYHRRLKDHAPARDRIMGGSDWRGSRAYETGIPGRRVCNRGNQ